MKSLLSHLPPLECPPYLAKQIWHLIQQRQEKRLKILSLSSLIGLGTCLGYLLWNWQGFIERITSSSFVEFIRLGMSDSDIVLAHGQEFLLGLVEALPLESILVGLTTFFFLLGTLALLPSLRHSRHLSPMHKS